MQVAKDCRAAGKAVFVESLVSTEAEALDAPGCPPASLGCHHHLVQCSGRLLCAASPLPSRLLAP